MGGGADRLLLPDLASGGVVGSGLIRKGLAANRRLKERVVQDPGVRSVPPLGLCCRCVGPRPRPPCYPSDAPGRDACPSGLTRPGGPAAR